MINVRNEKFNQRFERIKGLPLRNNERVYFGELERLVEDYKKTILFRKLFNDSLNVQELREKLNSYYDENSFIDDDFVGDDNFNNSLINIENSLLIFEQDNCTYNNDSRMELLSVFSSGLGDVCYFGDNRIVDGTRYGVELVRRISDILANKSLMDELTSVVSISNKLLSYKRIKRRLEKVLNNKDKLYDNIGLISEYSSLRAELNGEFTDKVKRFFDISFYENQREIRVEKKEKCERRFFKTEADDALIGELKRQIAGLDNQINVLKKNSINIKNRIEEIRVEFREKGIQDLVFADYNGEVDESAYLLENVSSKEDLDNYLGECQKAEVQCEDICNSYSGELSEKIESISPETRELLKNNFFTCQRILKLSKQKNNIGIRKEYCLFALDILLNLNDMTYIDFDFDLIDDEETSEFIDNKRKEIDSFCDEQNAKLNAIVHPKNNSLSEFVKK